MATSVEYLLNLFLLTLYFFMFIPWLVAARGSLHHTFRLGVVTAFLYIYIYSNSQAEAGGMEPPLRGTLWTEHANQSKWLPEDVAW